MFNIADLPVGNKRPALNFPHFPTRQQAFVWRNWYMVEKERLADVLETSVDNVTRMAVEMGLPPQSDINRKWKTNGYITIIRQNWHLLPYEQLLKLLGWTVDKLMYTLKEDDFLFSKMGSLKPECKPLVCRPLTGAEKISTVHLKEMVSRHFPNISEAPQAGPFLFMEELKESPENRQSFPENKNIPEGFIRLDSEWKLFIASKTVRTVQYAGYFKEKLNLIFQVKLGGTENKEAEKLIILELNQSFKKDCPAETFRIIISENKITLSAAKEAGIFRGLRWLVDKMLSKRGPLLPKGSAERNPQFDLRLIYPYFAVYGDPFMANGKEICPEGLLDTYAALGVNAIWFQTVLYSMVPFDRTPEYSKGYETRIKNLKALVQRVSKYGIGIYLYFNEPRAMPFRFYDKYPEWKGAENDTADIYAMCTSTSALENLKERTAKLFRQVPGIAGIFTITASENFSNCRSHTVLCDGGNFGFKTVAGCPRCKTRPYYDIMTEVNRAIQDGVHSVDPDVRFIAWTWGWEHYTIPSSPASAIEVVKHLPKSMNVMCVSEGGMPVTIGGVKGKVCDYSISQPGPGPGAKKIWKAVTTAGMEAVAKIQVNNTWECSAVPYIPVPNLILEHLHNLKNCRVNNLMLSWTLGGSPSFNLKAVSESCWDKKSGPEKILENLSEKVFGKNASAEVCKAFAAFSRSFREFPEFAGGLYNGPHTFGPANLLYPEPTGYMACMTGFAYDDLACWRGARHKGHAEFPEDKFEHQFKILSEGWRSGLGILAAAGKKVPAELKPEFQDLENVAIAVYCHFRTTYLQIRFVRMRDRLQKMPKKEARLVIPEIIDLINEEIRVAKMLEAVIRQDSRIGYEASNQYYYDIQAVREKVLNCEHLKSYYEGRLTFPEIS